MSILSDQEIEELGLVYLVANTPRYLFKHLRAHPSVQRMGEEVGVDFLLPLYSKNLKKQTKSIGEICVAYAALIAMSYKDWETVAPLLEALETKGLDWGSEILDILRKTEWPAKTISLAMQPSGRPFYENVASDSTFTSTSYRPEPIIKIVRG